MTAPGGGSGQTHAVWSLLGVNGFGHVTDGGGWHSALPGADDQPEGQATHASDPF